MVDNDLWIGTLLINATTASGEALRAHIRVVGLIDASDLAATT